MTYEKATKTMHRTACLWKPRWQLSSSWDPSDRYGSSGLLIPEVLTAIFLVWGLRDQHSPEKATGGTHCKKSFFIMLCSVRCRVGSWSSEDGDRSQR